MNEKLIKFQMENIFYKMDQTTDQWITGIDCNPKHRPHKAKSVKVVRSLGQPTKHQ